MIMNTDNELIRSLTSQNDKEENPDIKGFILRNLKYWPLLLFLVIASVILSWLYVRYTPKSYRAEAMLAIKKDQEITSQGSLRIALLDDKNALEKEVEILKSPDAIEQTAKILRLYADVKSKGRLLKKDIYGPDNPFIISVSDPQQIVGAGPFDLNYKRGSKEVIIAGKNYLLDSTYSMPWGRTTISLNPDFKGDLSEYELGFISLNDLVASIRGRLSADPRNRQSELIILSVHDHSGKRAVDILNTIVKVYDDITVDSKKSGYLGTYKFIDDRLSLVEKELNGVESQIASYKSSQGVVDLSTQGTAYLQSVQQVDQQIAELNVQLDLVNRAKSYMQKGPNQSGSLPAMVDIGDARLSNQINELNKTDLELNRQLQLSGPDNPRVKVLEDQSQRLRASLNEGLGNISKNLESSRNFYVGKQSSFNSMLRSIPQKEKGLIDITRQQTIKNGIFSFLLQRREEAAIAVAGTVANSQFIRKPMYAGVLKPTGMKTLMITLPIALFLFFIFIALREMFRNSLEEKQEVEKQVGAPIIAELSQYRRAKGEPETVMVVGEGKQTIEAEQFRDLRTNLNYLGLHKDNKVVLVTSSIPGEGKTYVSINLAISLALTGKKVALLALDLRRPKISKEVGISPVPGITEYLIGNAKLDNIIKPMPGFHSLFLLPEGSLPPNPAELLMSEAMGRMISELKQRFDYIIFDSPPIGAVTDAKVLANHANVSVYVTRVGRTLKSFFPMIKESYERRILPNMGVVVNGIKFSKMSRYGQRYGYAYERQEEKG
jgi:tyrosine-protein kinase Etk/Wzc